MTIGGRSAGGHSVGIHRFHNYGEDSGKTLFAGAIHQSGFVTARAFPNATYPLYQQQMGEYMSYLGCPQDDKKGARNISARLRLMTFAMHRDLQQVRPPPPYLAILVKHKATPC